MLRESSWGPQLHTQPLKMDPRVLREVGVVAAGEGF